jgi:hypothetical protein
MSGLIIYAPTMRPIVNLFARIAHLVALACFIFAPSIALSGTVSFSVDFAPNEVVLTNTGSEAAYRLSMWTLDGSEKWQRVPVLLGNADYLEPQQQVKGRRQLSGATSGLALGDPLLVMLFDKAGSRIVQLAWRQAPAAALTALPTQRHGSQLVIAGANAGAAKIVASYGITVPYAGVARLAQGFAVGEPPPDPLRHLWARGAAMTLDTGAAQAGVWLVHQTASGELQLQTVVDGKARGFEQVPTWLTWVRRHWARYVQALAGLGAFLLLAGLVLAGRQKSVENLAK